MDCKLFAMDYVSFHPSLFHCQPLDQVHLSWTGLLCPGEGGLEQTEVQSLQVPDHGPGCREEDGGDRTPERGEGAGLQDKERPSDHPNRKVPACRAKGD